MANIIRRALVIGGILGCAIWGGSRAWQRLPAAPVMVNIPPGSSAREVARLLKNERLIWSEQAFLAYARLTGDLQRLKAGAYLLSPRATLFSLSRTIAAGRSRCFKVTIPEGFTAAQIADLLDSQGLAHRDAFLKRVAEEGLEGYLFPETYFLEPYLGEDRIIERMTAEFHKAVPPDFLEQARRMNMTERDLVTLASLVEREAVRPEERGHIAGVFRNRLRKRWFLESCATVQYALGVHKARLSIKDTRIDSPYNTYRHIGLPPGPICNPGAAALRAAAYPAETDDMFFVASDSGTHVFSRYFKEHVDNKRQVRRRRM